MLKKALISSLAVFTLVAPYTVVSASTAEEQLIVAQGSGDYVDWTKFDAPYDDYDRVFSFTVPENGTKVNLGAKGITDLNVIFYITKKGEAPENGTNYLKWLCELDKGDVKYSKSVSLKKGSYSVYVKGLEKGAGADEGKVALYFE